MNFHANTPLIYLLRAAVVENINHQIDTHSYGRLFAVVQIAGKQFKITHEDIIVVQGYFAPAPGDVIRLEKVP